MAPAKANRDRRRAAVEPDIIGALLNVEMCEPPGGRDRSPNECSHLSLISC
jgi:hypothetical protein